MEECCQVVSIVVVFATHVVKTVANVVVSSVLCRNHDESVALGGPSKDIVVSFL